jgi:hypothetical protein
MSIKVSPQQRWACNDTRSEVTRRLEIPRCLSSDVYHIYGAHIRRLCQVTFPSKQLKQVGASVGRTSTLLYIAYFSTWLRFLVLLLSCGYRRSMRWRPEQEYSFNIERNALLVSANSFICGSKSFLFIENVIIGKLNVSSLSSCIRNRPSAGWRILDIVPVNSCLVYVSTLYRLQKYE